MTSAPLLERPPDSYLAAAIESDRRYFEAAAERDHLDGADLVWMPGLAGTPAAVVVHRVEPTTVRAGGDAWFDRLERRLAELGSALARIYLDSRDPALDALLVRRGYVDRDEIALVGDRVLADKGRTTLRLVDDDAGWRAKLHFHAADEKRPDGHPASAQAWVDMERAKAEAGAMQCFLVEEGTSVVGVIGAMRVDGILRIKNVATHPAHRRQGVGAAMMAHMGALASATGDGRVCIFAVRGEAGERLYRSVGLQEAGCQIEWSRPLPAWR